MFYLPCCLLLVISARAVQVAPAQTHLKIAFGEQFGVLAFKRDKNGTVIGYSGPVIELFTWMSNRMKFSYTIIPAILRLDPLPNGTWSGAIGLLESKNVDIVFGAVPTAPNIYRVADFTATVREEPVMMLIPAPVEENRAAAIIKPFTLTVWLILITVFMVVPMSLCALKRMEQHLKHSSGEAPTTGQLVLTNIQLFLGQGGFSGPSFGTLAQRLTLAGWTFAVLIFVNCYTGSFISYATAPKLVAAVETVQDAAYNTRLEPVLTAKGQLSLFVNQTGDGALKILGDKFRKNPNLIVPKLQDVVERVSSGCCIFFYPEAALELMLYTDLKETGECRCSITKTPVLWDYYVVATQRNTSLATTLSKEILWAKATGLLEYWMQRSIKHPYKCLNPEPSKIRPLTMKDLSGVFMILATGMLLSIVVFILEVLTSKIRAKKVRKITNTRK